MQGPSSCYRFRNLQLVWGKGWQGIGKKMERKDASVFCLIVILGEKGSKRKEMKEFSLKKYFSSSVERNNEKVAF